MKTLICILIMMIAPLHAFAQQASIEYINGTAENKQDPEKKDTNGEEKKTEEEKPEEKKPKELKPSFPADMIYRPREMVVYSNNWLEELKATLEAVDKIEVTTPKRDSGFSALNESSIEYYGNMGIQRYTESRDALCSENCLNVDFQASFCDNVVKRLESEGKVVWRSEFSPSRSAGFWFWEPDYYYKHNCEILYFPSQEAYRAHPHASRVDKLIDALEKKLHRAESNPDENGNSAKNTEESESFKRAIGEDLVSFNEHRGDRDPGFMPSFRIKVRRVSYRPYFQLEGFWRDKGEQSEHRFTIKSFNQPDNRGGWNGTMFRDVTGYRIIGELEDSVRGGRLVEEVKDGLKLEAVHGIQFFLTWERTATKNDGGYLSFGLHERRIEAGTAILEVYDEPVWKDGSNIQAEFWFTLLERTHDRNGVIKEKSPKRRVDRVWEPLVSVSDSRYKAIKDKFWDKSERSLRVRHPVSGEQCLRMGPRECAEYFPSTGLDDETVDELTSLNNHIRALLETSADIAIGDINEGEDRSSDDILAEKLRAKKVASVEELKKFPELYSRFIQKIFLNMLLGAEYEKHSDWQWVVSQQLDILASRPIDATIWKYMVFVFASDELKGKYVPELFTNEEIKGLWKKRTTALKFLSEEKVLEIYGEITEEEKKEIEEAAKKEAEEKKTAEEAQKEAKAKEKADAAKAEVVKNQNGTEGETPKQVVEETTGESPKEAEGGNPENQDPSQSDLTEEENLRRKHMLFAMIMQQVGRSPDVESTLLFNIAIRPTGRRFSLDHQKAAVAGLVKLATEKYTLDGQILYDLPWRYLIALANNKIGGKPIVYEDVSKDEETGKETRKEIPLSSVINVTARVELSKLSKLNPTYEALIQKLREDAKKEEESLKKFEDELEEALKEDNR